MIEQRVNQNVYGDNIEQISKQMVSYISPLVGSAFHYTAVDRPLHAWHSIW